MTVWSESHIEMNESLRILYFMLCELDISYGQSVEQTVSGKKVICYLDSVWPVDFFDSLKSYY